MFKGTVHELDIGPYCRSVCGALALLGHHQGASIRSSVKGLKMSLQRILSNKKTCCEQPPKPSPCEAHCLLLAWGNLQKIAVVIVGRTCCRMLRSREKEAAEQKCRREIGQRGTIVTLGMSSLQTMSSSGASKIRVV
jgi:hypothetical protein